MRYATALLAFILTIGAAAVYAQETTEVTLHKDPLCGCCEGYANYLRANGFSVNTVHTSDVGRVQQEAGIPQPMQACHMMTVEGYTVAGHVPLAMLRRLLAERPDIKGISLPGMPTGTPGMPGPKTEPFVVYEIPADAPTPVNEYRVYDIE